MKKLYLFTILTLLCSTIFAQQNGFRQRNGGNSAAMPPPLPIREVSGIIRDTVGNPIIGALITLTSKTDTLRTATNADGIFVIKNVKAATFVMSITSIGYIPSTRKYLNNDAAKKVVLDPIVMKTESNMLKEVNVNGTPSITYKTDTVEYKASDYKVRENATVDELLKKMEGMEVGSDGSLTHQGQQVKKARLNGKDYAGGNVAQAIQNLPADIVEKVQIIDDYGDEAARTGVKNGDPQKVLNITTRADRSVGNIARLTAGAGTDDRYLGNVFAQRINANEVISVIGNFKNTVNGVASTGINSGSFGSQSSGGGSGGTTKSITPTISYADQWGKKISVTASYSYNYNNVNALSVDTGQRYLALDTALTHTRLPVDTTTYFGNHSNSNSLSITHQFNFDFRYSIDSANYLQITPNYGFTSNDNSSSGTQYQTGYIHQSNVNNTSSNSTNPNYGATVLYQHMFRNKRRNISLQLTYSHNSQKTLNEQRTNIFYYADSVSTANPFLDSLVHRTIQRGSMTANYRASLTYVEPLNLLSQLEFNAQFTDRVYNNNAYTNNIDSANNVFPIDSLTNIYHYSFAQGRFSVNYRLNKTKYNLSLGITAIPTLLQGERPGLTAVRRPDFNLIPIIRYSYSWSRQERISIYYNGTPTEPTFNELQPYTDLTNPQNPVVGNPDLKPSFTHSLNLQYNNYVANSHLNLSANVSGSLINNQVTTNNVLVPVVVTKTDSTGAHKTTSYIPYTNYVNLNGSYNINGNYNIAKQFDDRRYNLELNGTVTYGYNVAMTNNIINHSETWRYNERFGPRMNPNDDIEINPYVSYDVTKSNNTIGDYKTDTRTTALSIDGKFYFLKTFMFGYSASKNFVTGISENVTKNPFVINASLQKEFFKKRNGILSIEAFDLLHQNNFVNRVITPTGYTDTKSNALSRYVLISFKMNLQKWSGTPSRKGRQLQRRGDGSFIY